MADELKRFTQTLGESLRERGVSRRGFLKFCTATASMMALPPSMVPAVAAALEQARRPSVIWLSFQECTGCTESLLRTSTPALDELILDLISLDYHEALMVPSGYLAEQAREKAMEENWGKYILVTEGATPMKDGGIYCKIGGKTAVDLVREVAADAGAVIAIGSCASWGGIPSADPNPTDAVGVKTILEDAGIDKAVVTLPGCPANPYNFLGTVLQLATLGTLPALDELGRPLFAYGRTIHESCERRAHFDAGRFARQYGDDGHRQGYCLYALGCKGPETHANCPIQDFGEIGAWPIGIGHPCFGCTEKGVGFTKALHQEAELPEGSYPPIHPDHRSSLGAAWAGVAGLVGGAAIGAGIMASKKLADSGSSSGGSGPDKGSPDRGGPDREGSS